MPHSITGKHRSKRPDNRPNAKKRKKQREDAYSKAEAKDVISTRIPKKEQESLHHICIVLFYEFMCSI